MQSSDNNHVLVLGGTGFIGRNLVQYLVENELASQITVVDKVPPQMAWLNEKHQKIFAHPSVKYKSANLISLASCQALFAEDQFDYVVNLAAETRPGLALSVYKEGIVKLALNCAKEASKQKVKKFVEVSSAQLFSSDKHAATEGGKPDPWTPQAKCKLEVEHELAKIPGLQYCVVRPALVYGLGDKHSLVPRLLIGAVYKQLQKPMKLLWTKDLHMNTVHVTDVCRAICHLLPRSALSAQETYNLVDKSNSTQGSLTKMIAGIFGIDYEFWGTTKSMLAKADMDEVVEEVNDVHLAPWAQMCAADGISNTPLTPYLYQEHLTDKGVYLDGTKLEENTGFQLQVPEVTESGLRQILEDYISMGLFPKSLLA